MNFKGDHFCTVATWWI